MSKARKPANKPAAGKAARKGPRGARVARVEKSDLRSDPAPAASAPQLVHSRPPQPTARPGREGRYVYGIVGDREPPDFGGIGIGAASELVYTVTHGDISAIVSKTPVFIFDPTRENALAHQHVIETVMKASTIIPMSFGAVFRTDDDVRKLLKSVYAPLKDALKQMAGKLEFGLKVTWDRDQVIEELKREEEDIRRLQQEIARKHMQSTYLARMQLGRMIDQALVERAAGYAREIYDVLRPVCVASRGNRPIGDKMIMNAAFLIEREKEADFDAAVNRIARRFGGRLHFKYTGPWPPYNFVNIRLKLERGTAS